MKRKLEEKILEEIRRIVIEKDLKRQTENEKSEMREANIEALTELTSLSRKEVEEISDDVRKIYVSKQKKIQKRNIRIAVIAVFAAFIFFLIFKPEKKLTEKPFEDNFSENINNWSIFNDFKYKRHFSNNQYVFETKRDGWCYWDYFETEVPENYDIEVSSSWQKGKYASYGVGLNEGNTNYYAFTLRADGAASFGKVVEKKWVIDDSWMDDKANKGKNQTNIQKIEVRSNKFNYFVNENLVRTGSIDLNIKGFSLRGCGEQIVAYNYVKITNIDTEEAIFDDDFSNPSKDWDPDKEFVIDSYFKDGQFIMDGNNEDNCNWANSSITVTRNCELKLSSIWLEGELATYGFMVRNSDDDYYSFELMNDGSARLVERIYGEYGFVQTYVNTNFESDGYKTIDQRLVVEDGEFSYYVNNLLIKEYDPEITFPASLSLRICGKQTVAFEHLDIKYYE